MRGQTSIDFVVGMSVFLLTVAFVVGFLPSVFEPFESDGGATAMSADRAATRLAGDLLGSPDRPGVVDAACTTTFFNASATASEIAACRFDENAADLRSALGIRSQTTVNVTVEDGGEVRRLDGRALSAGPVPRETGTVVVARRVVLLDGDESTLYVRVW